jgi:lactonase family protein with 7-bladed beta-propeller
MRTPSLSCSWRLLGIGLGTLLVPACGGGAGGGSSSRFEIVEASNGFGKLLPYQINELDENGLETGEVVELTRIDQLIANATLGNPVLPPTEWPVTAVLPNSVAGNQFAFVRFSQAIDPTTVLSSSSADAPGTLGDGIQVQMVDSITGTITPLEGRAFVGGQAYGPDLDPSEPGSYLLQTWVRLGGTGIEAATISGATPGLGFPGTEPATSFAGDTVLVEPATFVFVRDEDNDLTTHETFPVGQSIQVRIGSGVRSTRGKFLEEVGLAQSTVGPDTIGPEVQVAGDEQLPVVSPAQDSLDVDPETDLIVQFTEPINALTIGDLDDGTPPTISSALSLTFGPSSARVQVPFTVRPISIFDLSRYVLEPAYSFPGTGPSLPDVPCESSFGKVDFGVNPQQFRDLRDRLNTKFLSMSFFTREGPGLVNAPVTPDALYLGRAGSNPGISVIDLNGFGQGTGNPTYDLNNPIKKGNSNFPNNPNVALNGAQLIPPLVPGTCTFNGGSAGPFSLVKDSSLRELLAGAPLLESVGDMALGHALDNTFNNATPFGCQSGGGNICVQSGLKRVSLIPGGPNTVASANISTGIAPLKTDSGAENLASWSPHPNPPPLVFPPICLSPLINGQEPTSILTTCVPIAIGGCNFNYGAPYAVSGGPAITNLLVPGPFPLGLPDLGLPPQGTLAAELNTFFEGPATPQPNIGLCQPYMMRQQVGQFLYVVDRVASEIVVMNSNRFTVLDRIRLLDPTSLAMSPNLDFLAVTNEGADQVTFIDIDPASATFHQVIKTTPVGTGPTGIAWESANEDIFVCNQGEGTVSIISGFTLDVRKTVRNQITRPIDVAVTPRQTVFGFARGVYFGYILNQNGTVAVFESGPNGINGFGFDDVIVSLPFRFQRPKTLQVDPTNLNSAVWIVHESPLDQNGLDTGQGGGAISNVGISGGLPGTIPLNPGIFTSPQVRDLQFSVLSSFGEATQGLSGTPVDVAFDNMRNLSALTNFFTTFSPGNPLSYNGKSLVKLLGFGALQVNSPQFMFVCVPNPGVVDVFDMTGGSFDRVDTDPFVSGFQSISAPNTTVLMDYFRQ